MNKTNQVYKEEDEFIEEEIVEDDEETIEKAIDKIRKIMKGEGTNASDDAEERLEDDIDEETQDNVDEVTKALRVLIGSVNKSTINKAKRNVPVAKSNDILEIKKAILDLTKVVKSVTMDQKESTQAVENILAGLGVVQKVATPSNRGNSTVQKSINTSARPVADRAISRRQIALEVRKALEETQVRDTSPSDRSNTREDVRKSLRDVMPDIFSVSK
jgi:hypothetical protein